MPRVRRSLCAVAHLANHTLDMHFLPELWYSTEPSTRLAIRALASGGGNTRSIWLNLPDRLDTLASVGVLPSCLGPGLLPARRSCRSTRCRRQAEGFSWLHGIATSREEVDSTPTLRGEESKVAENEGKARQSWLARHGALGLRCIRGCLPGKAHAGHCSGCHSPWLLPAVVGPQKCQGVQLPPVPFWWRSLGALVVGYSFHMRLLRGFTRNRNAAPD